MKTALICGISGQDGSLLANLLIQKGYKIFGTSRDAEGTTFNNLIRLNVLDKVKLISMAPEEFRSVYSAIKISNPDEIYFLSGQSSVGLSFDQPAETIQSITLGTLNMLEACRMYDKPIKQYHAGSSECFGDTNGVPASENTPFNPKSPYAVAKVASFWLVNNYREAYGLFACTGILFNHESPLRPQRFVTQKIIQTVKRIAAGSDEKLWLGRLDIKRDWGWAPDYVLAMWKMLQQDNAKDFVIATGRSISLKDFVVAAFSHYNLNWTDYVMISDNFIRPSEIQNSSADPSNARKYLSWSSESDIMKLTYNMIHDVYY